jgi:hypothetical protein
MSLRNPPHDTSRGLLISDASGPVDNIVRDIMHHGVDPLSAYYDNKVGMINFIFGPRHEMTCRIRVLGQGYIDRTSGYFSLILLILLFFFFFLERIKAEKNFIFPQLVLASQTQQLFCLRI